MKIIAVRNFFYDLSSNIDLEYTYRYCGILLLLLEYSILDILKCRDSVVAGFFARPEFFKSNYNKLEANPRNALLLYSEVGLSKLNLYLTQKSLFIIPYFSGTLLSSVFSIALRSETQQLWGYTLLAYLSNSQALSEIY
jgi:hypothetical protein